LGLRGRLLRDAPGRREAQGLREVLDGFLRHAGLGVGPAARQGDADIVEHALAARIAEADVARTHLHRHDPPVAWNGYKTDVVYAGKAANDKQALLVAQNQYKQTLLVLARNLGMSPGTPLEIAETLQFRALPTEQTDVLLPAALLARSDYLSLASQRRQLVEQQRASRARFYPKVSINGNYGGIGRSIGGVQGTGLLQGQIDFTLFDRDRQGEADELAARIKGIDDRIADMRRGVEEDVREAVLNLESAAEQVSVAKDGQQLAQRELELAQDRFAQGTANNVEVVTAQDELARAQENYILAVSSHVDAKFALARAMGDTEKNIAKFVGEP